jgi:hypothetical protein
MDPNHIDLSAGLDPNYHNTTKLQEDKTKQQITERNETRTQRALIISIAFAILIGAVFSWYKFDITKVKAANNAQITYWLPEQQTQFYNQISLQAENAKKSIVIVSPILTDKNISNLAIKSAQNGLDVLIITDGQEKNININEKNAEYYTQHGIRFLIDKRERNQISYILIDGNWGIVSSGTFNTKFIESRTINLVTNEKDTLDLQKLTQLKLDKQNKPQ